MSFLSTKFAPAVKPIKCGKVQSPGNIPFDLFGSTAAPNELHGFRKRLRDLPKQSLQYSHQPQLFRYQKQAKQLMTELPVHIAAERVLQAFRAVTLEAFITCL